MIHLKGDEQQEQKKNQFIGLFENFTAPAVIFAPSNILIRPFYFWFWNVDEIFDQISYTIQFVLTNEWKREKKKLIEKSLLLNGDKLTIFMVMVYFVCLDNNFFMVILICLNVSM